MTDEIEANRQQEANCRRLMSIPGIGPLISTAMVAAIGTGEAFDRGRDFGAWLGLVPRQYSTGGKPVLGRHLKTRQRYLRTLFVQAAHIILMRPHNWQRFSFGPWLQPAAPRMHKNKLAAALANKLARIAWSILGTARRSNDRIEARNLTLVLDKFAIEMTAWNGQETHPDSDDRNGRLTTCPLMRPMARAYSHHGHGPQADQTGRIHISDFRYPAKSRLRPAAGPYIWVIFGPRRQAPPCPLSAQKRS